MKEDERWSVQDSIDLYHISAWGAGYFRVNAAGNVEVTPQGPEGPSLDLYDLAGQLSGRGLDMPLLLRFPDILRSRIDALTGAFGTAIQNENYQGRYHCIYPIKVNQQHRVVGALVEHGQRHGLGLEAGSKPELLVALALADNPEALLILNGYKDHEYMETALLANKLGRNAIIVVDRYRELDMILHAAERLNVRPRIGVRAKLDARAESKWTETSGQGSKFGLGPEEIVRAVEKLRHRGMLDCLELLHFHIGSQITSIRSLRDALIEAARMFVEITRMGAALRYLDVGGGLGVDYDGSKSTSESSANYDLQEYANDVIFHIREICDEQGVKHPDILSESGRALVAHHSALILNVPDLEEGLSQEPPEEPLARETNRAIRSLFETWRAINPDNVQESWHDANYAREEAVTLFRHGIMGLEGRARVDHLYQACCAKILKLVRQMDPIPDELRGLERRFCDTFYGNFSVFQSTPDHWAVDQLFPIMPIHRLNEKPARRGIIADLTCDSDGKIDRFIGIPREKQVIELHALNGQPYYIGIFLIGAYQEILGDLHNLFGDTNAVHVSVDVEGKPILDDVVEQDTVADVLGYVGFDRRDLRARMRRAVERALQRGNITLKESALFLRHYENGLSGTTYLEEESGEEEQDFPQNGGNGGNSEATKETLRTYRES
ncbi:MAG TPA: biosynthetic arginine decarboxylase [bacterium]|nr:biosynthetic arginine decarboxylase [bacterium]